jgi:hypothetical protein
VVTVKIRSISGPFDNRVRISAPHGRDEAAGAGLALDDERSPGPLRELLREHAGEEIGAAAGCEGIDDVA